MTAGEQDWQALAEAVRRRRTALGLSQAAFTLVSAKTIYAIETATANTPRPATLARIERELGWRPGLVEEVLAGTATEGEIMPTNDAAANASPAPADRRKVRSEVCDELDGIRRMILDDVNEGRMSVGRAAELIARIEDQATRLKGASEGPDEIQGRTQP